MPESLEGCEMIYLTFSDAYSLIEGEGGKQPSFKLSLSNAT